MKPAHVWRHVRHTSQRLSEAAGSPRGRPPCRRLGPQAAACRLRPLCSVPRPAVGARGSPRSHPRPHPGSLTALFRHVRLPHSPCHHRRCRRRCLRGRPRPPSLRVRTDHADRARPRRLLCQLRPALPHRRREPRPRGPRRTDAPVTQGDARHRCAHRHRGRGHRPLRQTRATAHPCHGRGDLAALR